MSTFCHDMVNLLGVILTYCDLLASDETKPAKISWLEQQGTATEQAIEMTKGLRALRPSEVSIGPMARSRATRNDQVNGAGARERPTGRPE